MSDTHGAFELMMPSMLHDSLRLTTLPSRENGQRKAKGKPAGGVSARPPITLDLVVAQRPGRAELASPQTRRISTNQFTGGLDHCSTWQRLLTLSLCIWRGWSSNVGSRSPDAAVSPHHQIAQEAKRGLHFEIAR
jgi:hypothetical protein